MRPKRWEQIERIYLAGREVEPDRRKAFLEEACAGDQELLAQVSSLLTQQGNSEGFLESPAIELVAKELAKDEAHEMGEDLPGRTISHYRVEEKIGEGGMGEVFLAWDLSLHRKVALKLVSPLMKTDAEGRLRFLREARSAAALNHPYICSIHEVAEVEGKEFIVMEYVEGQTLAEKLATGPLPISLALTTALEVAEALQAAHREGIIHRDIKPSNVMLTAAGHAKVMDFGLAKRVFAPDSGESHDQSVAAVTKETTTFGTVAYMSPEQVRGEPVDARSDIFSFGLLLYEMLTGTHPFLKKSRAETASAILHDEARPVTAIAPEVPADLEQLISGCLSKEVDQRVQRIDAVKLGLEKVKARLDSVRPGFLTGSPRAHMRLVVLALAVACLIFVGWNLFAPRSRIKPEMALTPVPLTSYPGSEVTPSFSPDGNRVAFAWAPDRPGTNFDIYIKEIGVEPPSPLTTGPGNDISPTWSPDGRWIAFVRRFSVNRGAVVLIPPEGRQERVLEELDTTNWIGAGGIPPYLSWTPDSKWLVYPAGQAGREDMGLMLISLETRERRRLTTSPGGFDSTPAVSPDGRTLVFSRQGHTTAGIWRLRMTDGYHPGREPPTLLTPPEDARSGVCWSSDGSGIIFAAAGVGTGIGRGLWGMRLPASAKPIRYPFASGVNYAPAVSMQGNRLAYTVVNWSTKIYRVDVDEPGYSPGNAFRFAESTRGEYCPTYSPNGTKVAFCSGRSGGGEIWVCDRDGANPVQITSVRAGGPGRPKWSPDGRWIVFNLVAKGRQEIVVVGASGGPLRRLAVDPPSDLPYWPSWSRDGQWIYFRHQEQVWKVPAAGGDPVQVTDNGGDVPEESFDGKLLYYTKAHPYPERCSLWRMPTGGGEETKVIEPISCIGSFAVWEHGVYFLTPSQKQGDQDINTHDLFKEQGPFISTAVRQIFPDQDINAYDPSTGKARKLLTIKGAWGWITASPDGQSVIYAAYDNPGADLMLVENFH